MLVFLFVGAVTRYSGEAGEVSRSLFQNLKKRYSLSVQKVFHQAVERPSSGAPCSSACCPELRGPVASKREAKKVTARIERATFSVDCTSDLRLLYNVKETS